MISSRLASYMQSAIDLSRRFPHDSTFHFASVLVHKSRIISVGYNYFGKTNPNVLGRFKFLHSEADAIIGIDSAKLYDSSLFVARTGYTGRSVIVMAKPCPMCQLMIRKAGVRRVFFTIEKGLTGLWDVRDNYWSHEIMEAA